MTRALAAAVGLSLAAPSLAQPPLRAAGAPPAAPAAPAGAAAAQAGSAAAAPSGPPAAPAPRSAKELEQAKKLGREGLLKLAPRLGGRAEKLARDKGGTVVDKAVDLAADKAGVLKK